ncbi:polysaccharide deacetylase family protein [Spirochaeta dissipatitropha]
MYEMGVSNALKMNYRALFLVVFAVLCVSGLSAELVFSDLHAGEDDRLLFSATVSAPSTGEYRTAFSADLQSGRIQQLSVFPEYIASVSPAGMVRVQNRFGLFYLNPANGSIHPQTILPAFVHGAQVQSGKVLPVSSSPNGSYFTYLDPVSPAHGRLILHDTARDRNVVLAERVPLTLGDPPVRWAPDSSLLIYSENGKLYYYSLLQHERGRSPSSDLRLLGPGSIFSVQWGRSGHLYYASGTIVYRVLPGELFTRSIYQQVLAIGEIVGRLPFVFESNFDRFYISPDGDSLLFSKAGRNLFFIDLKESDSGRSTGIITLPYMYLPRGSSIDQVLWSADNIITIAASSLENGQNTSRLFRVVDANFSAIQQNDILGISLSPGQDRIIIRTKDSVQLRRYRDWTLVSEFSAPGSYDALWLNDREILIAGKYIYELIDVSSGQRSWAGFTQPAAIGLDVHSLQQLVAGGDEIREWNPQTGTWRRRENFLIADPRTASRNFRVYTENQPESSRYRNLIMLRDSQGLQTRSLIPRPEQRYEEFPAQDDPVDQRVFAHGSRIRRREISLVFNAIDNDEGLLRILQVLNDFEIKATFFLNGDFIIRNPAAARDIAEAGHEIGNLFHSYFDMTDERFQITSDFIQQGLVLNEDLFFEATGRELSMLWHAPYYYVSSSLLSAAEELNYQYIGRDVDALDWVAKGLQDGTQSMYRPSAELVERIVDLKKPGSIIAMRIGVPHADRIDGGRDDYLFQYLDILVNSLTEKGYSFVPVSTLRDRVR